MVEAGSVGVSKALAAPGKGGGRLYLVVFLIFATLYGLTAQRGVGWQDSGIYQWRILNFDLTGWLGLALAHPLLIAVGKVFSFLPFGSLAWRMNFVSAFFGALAVANVALLVRRLVPQRRVAAWVAAGVFGLTHTVWWLGTICESQTLLVALFTAELNVLLSLMRRPQESLVLLLGLLNGLALTAHNLALLGLPGYGLTVLYFCSRRRLPFRAVIWIAAGWLVGSSGYLILVVHRALAEGMGAGIHSALFGDNWEGAVLGGSGKAVLRGCAYVLYNFPNLALPLMVLAIPAMRKHLPRPGAWVFGYLTVVYLGFAIRYPVQDQFMFFLPFYAMVGVFAGLGVGSLSLTPRRRWVIWVVGVSVAVSPILHAAAPMLSRTFHMPVPGRKDLAYRDPYRYWLSPWKVGEDSAQRFAREALGTVRPGGLIVADGTSFPPLVWTQRVEDIGEGVRVLKVRDANRQTVKIGSPDVFVVSNVPGYFPPWLEEVGSLQKRGQDDILFRVSWNPASGSGSGS